MSINNPVIDFIDGPARRIHLRSGVSTWHPIDDIYPEVLQLRSNDESLRRFDMFCSALEQIDDGNGGSLTGRGLILLQGTRISPFDEDTHQDITGALLSDEGLSGTDLVDLSILSDNVKVSINYLPPPATEVINGGGDGDALGQEDAEKLDAILRYQQDVALNMQPH